MDLRGITLTVPGKGSSPTVLLHEAEVHLCLGHRYALVGPNGCGKSSLLHHIHQKAAESCVDVLYVQQEDSDSFIDGSMPAFAAVLCADKKRTMVLERKQTLLTNPCPSLEELAELQTLEDQLTAMGGDAAEARVRRILHGLGFSPEWQNRAVHCFSGGWRMRICLARALFMQPRLLLLDECTNHLDLHAIIWLIQYLQKYGSRSDKTILMVSHDRNFLDQVCTDTLMISERSVLHCRGTCDDIERQIRAKSKKPKKCKGEMQSKKSMRGPKEYKVTLPLSGCRLETTDPILELQGLDFGFPNQDALFRDVNVCVHAQSRICVVGPNGAGKSTLLSLLMGTQQATKGHVRRNRHLRVACYSQHFAEQLPENVSAVQHVLSLFQKTEPEQACRKLLGSFGLPGFVHCVPMRQLSGGQKARVVLTTLTLAKPHLLLLDEPTNHLDKESITALCASLCSFPGAVIMVSHDGRLIQDTGAELWTVNEGSVAEFDGDFEDYTDMILDRMSE